MDPTLDFIHRWIPGAEPLAPVLLLLHGTGGNEGDLLDLGRAILPGAALLSPRGKVLEKGMPRFFRRLTEGVFDEKDLVERTHELAAFLETAAARYGFEGNKVIAVGYSNGANIAASTLLLRPEVLDAAVLLRAMVPLVPPELPDLSGVPVFLAAGQSDPLISPENVERLAAMLRQAHADAALHWTAEGHGVVPAELDEVREWLHRNGFAGGRELLNVTRFAAVPPARGVTGRPHACSIVEVESHDLQLMGVHHLTAITARASANHAFYTETLGMRLVKKTVNQDDVSAYHLFYADGQATPGSDLTFFDWPAPPERRGTRSIVSTGLRVDGRASLQWWAEHLARNGVRSGELAECGGRWSLPFEDPEGQRLLLVDDGGSGEGHPWEKSAVPAEHQIRGLGPIRISIPALAETDAILTDLLNMRRVREYPLNGDETAVHIYQMGAAGPAGELHVAVEPNLPAARQGAGGVHHVAFRVAGFSDYDAWAERLVSHGIPSSGPVDRFYFRSLYFREPNGILFELATDGPGFAVDEPLESLGERLALPPFLEPRRREIEAGLKPLD